MTHPSVASKLFSALRAPSTEERKPVTHPSVAPKQMCAAFSKKRGKETGDPLQRCPQTNVRGLLQEARKGNG